MPDRKEKLGQMIDALIKNKSEESRIAFHDYLGPRIKEVVHGPQDNGSENAEED
jgi:hypothetical protein